MADPRPTAAQRGYGATWRKRRKEQLERQPWCELCLKRAEEELGYPGIPSTGTQAAATTVDHRRPRRTYPPDMQRSAEPGGADHPSNLRSLCTSHHCRVKGDKARRASE